MKQYITPVISNSSLCVSLYLLEFRLEGIEDLPLPGQFFTLRVSDLATPLLRRPFAFSSFNVADRRAGCIYKVRGSATEILSRLVSGASLDIIAPLGRPFPLPQPSERPLLIAGGIGLGPILFLADKLKQCGIEYRMVFGCRSKAYFPQTVFEGRNVTLCTDDGSMGFHGTAVDYLRSITSSLSNETTLYCCGPLSMLRECHTFASERKIRCFVSVEEVMACGIGACMGCAVKVSDERLFVRACKEGPVFESGEIEWERLI